MFAILRFTFLVPAFLLCAEPVLADSIQLANGEVLKGKVLSLDDKQVNLESESLGKVTLPRSKVAIITLGDAKLPVASSEPKATPTPAAPAPMTVDDVLKQLKSGSVNPKDINDLQKLFPELASPEASKYFDNTLKNLQTGKSSIQDLRKDAIKARDELKKLNEELGPDAAQATAPYLAILEKFIGETQTKDEKKTEGKTPQKK